MTRQCHIVKLFHHGSEVIGGAGGRSVLTIGARFFFVVVNSWLGELRSGVMFSGGPWLLDLCCLPTLCAVKRTRTGCPKSHAKSWMTWNVDDKGASCRTVTTRTLHAESWVGSRIWTCRCSASYQQSRHSSSSGETPSLTDVTATPEGTH